MRQADPNDLPGVEGSRLGPRRSKLHRALTPNGVRDWLPQEAASKRAIEQLVRELFSAWGYSEVITPSFEFERVVEQRAGGSSHPFYRLMDRDGDTLALRSEITPSVARLAATRLRGERAPLRLGYVGTVFRYDEPQAGRMREFTQAGVELIGVGGPAADAEVIALAAAVLDGVGLLAHQIDIGHVGFWAGLLDGVSGGGSGKGAGDADTGDVDGTGEAENASGRRALLHAIKSALLRRDFVGLAEQVAGAQFPEEIAELLTSLDSLRGGPEVLDYAEERVADYPKALKAIEELRATHRHIAAYGLEDRVSIDLGLAKDVEYYTGMVLEGYSEEVGYTLCTGGRYDRLIERFGDGRPATGVAFGVDRLLLARERKLGDRRTGSGKGVLRRLNEVDVLAVVPEDGCGLVHVRRWRRRGLRVAVELVERPVEETLAYARGLGATKVISFEADDHASRSALLYDLENERCEDGAGRRHVPAPETIDPAQWDGPVRPGNGR